MFRQLKGKHWNLVSFTSLFETFYSRLLVIKYSLLNNLLQMHLNLLQKEQFKKATKATGDLRETKLLTKLQKC